MLKFLKLDLGGFFAKPIQVEIQLLKDGMVTRVSSDRLALPDHTVLRPMPRMNDWLERMEQLNLSSWEDEYSPEGIVLDGIQWFLEVEEEGGPTRKISGDNAYPEEWMDFLELLDEVVPEAGLVSPNRVEKLALYYQHRFQEYRRGTAFWVEYSESLVVERKTHKIRYLRQFSPDATITQEYHLPGLMKQLLDALDELLENFSSSGARGLDTVLPVMEVSIFRHDGQIDQVVFPYHRREIPEVWPSLIDEIRSALAGLRRFGDIFDSDLYNHGVKAGEHIYCRVRFEDSAKEYHYRTLDDTLQPGDRVVVPVGPSDYLCQGTIQHVEYYPEEEVPYPLEKTKFILRRLDKEE